MLRETSKDHICIHIPLIQCFGGWKWYPVRDISSTFSTSNDWSSGYTVCDARTMAVPVQCSRTATSNSAAAIPVVPISIPYNNEKHMCEENRCDRCYL